MSSQLRTEEVLFWRSLRRGHSGDGHRWQLARSATATPAAKLLLVLVAVSLRSLHELSAEAMEESDGERRGVTALRSMMQAVGAVKCFARVLAERTV